MPECGALDIWFICQIPASSRVWRSASQSGARTLVSRSDSLGRSGGTRRHGVVWSAAWPTVKRRSPTPPRTSAATPSDPGPLGTRASRCAMWLLGIRIEDSEFAAVEERPVSVSPGSTCACSSMKCAESIVVTATQRGSGRALTCAGGIACHCTQAWSHTSAAHAAAAGSLGTRYRAKGNLVTDILGWLRPNAKAQLEAIGPICGSPARVHSQLARHSTAIPPTCPRLSAAAIR